MRLAQKLILYALAVALIPIAATGFTLIRVSQDALRERIEEHQRAAAVAVAANVTQTVEDLARQLGIVMKMVDVPTLTMAEREGVSHLLYRQADDIRMVALFRHDGKLLTRATYFGVGEAVGTSLERHPSATAEEVKKLYERLPRHDPERARAGTILMSPVFFPDGAAARVAISVACCEGVDGKPRAFAGVDIALRASLLRVEGVETGSQSSVFVVDRNGTVIVHPTKPAGTDLRSHGAVAAFLTQHASETAIYETADGRFAAAFAPVGQLGWGVIVEQPEAVAYHAAYAMRDRTLFWILGTTLIVLLSGFWFASRLRRTLVKMVEGARAFGEGRLGRRIDVESSDEIGELADTMNAMAAQLGASLRELENWGLTLETRVKERTAELQDAQAQLLMQSKMAAIGQLGAGVAHEVNNPLAGILGLSQLMVRSKKEDDPDYQSLKDIETAAKRCKEITMRLLRFSEQRLSGRNELLVIKIIDEVLGILDESFKEAKIEVKRDYADDLPKIVADTSQLGQVFTNLLTNARTSMLDEGGTLTVSARGVDEGVEIVVQDTGVGIEADHLSRVFDPFFTTKKVWTDVGLGLSVTHRVVTDHGGRIDVESSPGRGAKFIVFLPFEPPEAPAEEELPQRRTVLLE